MKTFAPRDRIVHRHPREDDTMLTFRGQKVLKRRDRRYPLSDPAGSRHWEARLEPRFLTAPLFFRRNLRNLNAGANVGPGANTSPGTPNFASASISNTIYTPPLWPGQPGYTTTQLGAVTTLLDDDPDPGLPGASAISVSVNHQHHQNVQGVDVFGNAPPNIITTTENGARDYEFAETNPGSSNQFLVETFDYNYFPPTPGGTGVITVGAAGLTGFGFRVTALLPGPPSVFQINANASVSWVLTRTDSQTTLTLTSITPVVANPVSNVVNFSIAWGATMTTTITQGATTSTNMETLAFTYTAYLRPDQ
jgi:hypothetical protein